MAEKVPAMVSQKQVNTARGAVFDEIAERMRVLSSQMGTEIRRDRNRLFIELENRRQ